VLHYVLIYSDLRTSKPKPYSRLPRGPPRKPKQSGHSIWVGSLPFNVSIINLRDHFSKGFTLEIESVFLMMKSNCAFINYSTERACQEAVKRFQNSIFMGVSLICRSRKSSGDVTDKTDSLEEEVRSQRSSDVSDDVYFQQESTENSTLGDEERAEKKSQPREPERFFILKSLSVQDLVRSVRYGIWTTQGHNEEVLNKAYHVSCEHNVFPFLLC
jgi:RNA recognition motif-containing protein